MARPFSTTDAKRVISQHQNIIEKLNRAVSSVEKYRINVKEASDGFLEIDGVQHLDFVPAPLQELPALD